VQVLSPIGKLGSAQFRPARRPSTLDGVHVGLFSNGKPNADRLLRAIAARIGTRFALAGTVELNKTTDGGSGPSFPAPEWMLDRLAISTAVVLAASGD
jgi:hypothetical protein